ncbi:alpha/beta hydrolase [Acetilactobacillus jinshanensis]|uniref:Alpha/beta hydrolase n=1 Tax=Acetilactobacillus jinshanensis TaxID=1720083 RepID=A0A4P6ZJA3_9LACO|nr:alpha/beta hydrolase [Acetilactobacillus jinshanensis]QBP17811.1 alpha/beta hydrolase [Acetilactobacillus jinshanensis]URL60673.1 alpha/beta hydrolase [uncultured bacterium]
MKIITTKLLKNSKAYLKGYIRSNVYGRKPKNEKFPAMIILPGGSFTHIKPQQAESFALAFTALGYQSFYLRYSFQQEHKPLYPYPMIELCKAIEYVRAHADEWDINPNQIVVAGFSVGGHVVSLLNDFYDSPWFKEESGFKDPNKIKPNVTILGYPVIDLRMGFPEKLSTAKRWIDNLRELRPEYHVTDTNVPTFTWVTADDNFVPSQNAMVYAYELNKHHIPSEFHMYYHGPHGLALANRVTAWSPETDDPHVSSWVPLADEFIHSIFKRQAKK